MQKFLEQLGLIHLDDCIYHDVMSGGMASTTLIYKDTTGNNVIVKMLIASRNEAEFNAFKNEAETLKKLTENEWMSFCPKLIDDIKQYNNFPIYYFKMEFVEGITLKKYLDSNGPLNWELALSITQRISTALGAGSGWYIHRDLHPGNIMLTSTKKFDDQWCLYDDPGVKILDYGCSKDYFKSITGQWYEDKFRHVGAISTWSPEFILNPQIVGPSHDSWAIGVILFYMLTKEYPFKSSCFGDLFNHYIKQDDSYLERIPKGIPYPVFCLINSLLSFYPEKRFAAGMIVDLCADTLYRGLGERNNDFVDTYMEYGGNIFNCFKCHTMVGRIHAKCPACGNVLDEETTYPELHRKDQKFWPHLPI